MKKTSTEARLKETNHTEAQLVLKYATIDDIWRKYDADNSGVLEKVEAQEFLKDLYIEVNKENPSEETIENTFMMVDPNNDSALSKEELKEYLRDLKLGIAFNWWWNSESKKQVKKKIEWKVWRK